MNKGRMEAFSDGVFAIIITIMVLEIKVPHGDQFKDLQKLLPVFLSYVLSFLYLAIYWNNHHHMMQVVPKVNGRILWANVNLLFWLSLLPFATGWMGENSFSPPTLAVYGIVLLLAGIAFLILQKIIIQFQGTDSVLKKAMGKDIKGTASVILYIIGIFASYINGWISGAMYIIVALMWLIPDRRIEKLFYQ